MTNKTNTDIAIQQLANIFTKVPFNRVLGLTLDHLDESVVMMHFNMDEALIGNYVHSILHGGVISTALDMAGGMAVMVHAISSRPELGIDELSSIIGKTSTIDLNINYLRPGKGESFVVKAWLVKGGKKVSFARMEIHNQHDLLIATGTGTYLTK